MTIDELVRERDIAVEGLLLAQKVCEELAAEQRMIREKLRQLLEGAEEVGRAWAEWQEQDRQAEVLGRYPGHQRAVAAAWRYYRDLRTRLYEAAEIPETEDAAPDRENKPADS